MRSMTFCGGLALFGVRQQWSYAARCSRQTGILHNRLDSIAFDAGTASGGWNDTADLVAGNKYLFAVIATTDGSGLAVPTSGFYGVDANGDNGTAFYEVTWDASTGGSFIAADSFAGASMTTAVVPEPTSGLLLLLGVAGIALRRRRA